MQDMPAEQARTGQAASLRDRLRFAGMEAADGERLRTRRQTLERHVETALRDLFQRFRTFPDAARHFQSDGEHTTPSKVNRIVPATPVRHARRPELQPYASHDRRR